MWADSTDSSTRDHPQHAFWQDSLKFFLNGESELRAAHLRAARMLPRGDRRAGTLNFRTTETAI